MSLHTSLRLAISTMSRVREKTPQPLEGVFDFLLTQGGDFIITQDYRQIAISLVQTVVLYDIVTEDGFGIITQDDRIIEAVG